MNPPKRQSMLRAFTLIELLVVMVIIASLSAMILPYLHHGDRIAHEEKTKAGMNIISTAIETYKSHVGVLPLSQWNINDPQPEWSPNNPYDTTNIWDPSNYLGDDPFAFNQSNRLLWRMSSRMDSAQKKKVKDAVEAAVLEVEMKIAPGGGGWEEFGVINYSTNYTTLLDEKRDWCESVPEINILRKRFDRTGDTYARNGDGSPVIISELATDDPNWGFLWGKCAGGAMASAWAYYSQEAKEDAKRLDYIMDVIDSSSIDEEMISEDGESILDAWGNPIIYIERDYRPMPLYGVFPPWYTSFLGRRDSGSYGIMGDMSRAGGCRKTIPDLDNDRAISDAEAAVTDQRCHAYPGDEFRFELWSAGGDGLFSALRGDDSSSNINYDNVQAGK